MGGAAGSFWRGGDIVVAGGGSERFYAKGGEATCVFHVHGGVVDEEEFVGADGTGVKVQDGVAGGVGLCGRCLVEAVVVLGGEEGFFALGIDGVEEGWTGEFEFASGLDAADRVDGESCLGDEVAFEEICDVDREEKGTAGGSGACFDICVEFQDDDDFIAWDDGVAEEVFALGVAVWCGPGEVGLWVVGVGEDDVGVDVCCEGGVCGVDAQFWPCDDRHGGVRAYLRGKVERRIYKCMVRDMRARV